MKNPGIRAGTIAALIATIFEFLALVPFFGCAILPLSLLLFLGAGALASAFLRHRRPTASRQQHAQAGFLAGLIAGIADAVVGIMTIPIALSLSGGSNAIVAQLPPAINDLIASLGMTSEFIFGATGLLIISAVLAIFTVVVATLSGTTGALIVSQSFNTSLIERKNP